MEFITELENRAKEFNQIQSMVLDIDTLQPLIDLGYLTFQEAKPDNPQQPVFLERAVRQFRKDCENYRTLRKKFTFLPFEKEHYHSYAKQLNEIEQDFIQNLVSFEGTFVLDKLPNFGTVSLATRIIHYRLEILGLYGKQSHQGIDAPFQRESLKGIEEIKVFFNWQISELDFLNAVGNIEDLLEDIYHKLNESDRHKKFIYMDKHGNFDTTKIISQTPEAVRQYYEFLARIFQIRLWMNGLYHGEIDGIIRNDNTNRYGTKKAIGELVQYLRQDEELRQNPTIIEKGYDLGSLKISNFYDKSRKLKAFWLNVVDLLFITKSMKDNHPVIAVADMLIDDKNERIQERIFKKEGQFKKEVKKELLERQKNFLKGKKRRLYYGIVQFGRTIRRVVRNIFEKIKLGFNFLKRIALIVYREVKEGIKVFFHGMSFLVGKRQILTSKQTITQQGEIPDDAIVSKYDLDCDSVVFVSNKTDFENEKRHCKKCENQMNSLKISLLLTALILRWVLLLTSGSIAWTPFLLMIARTLKQIKRTKFGHLFSKIVAFV